MTTPDFTRVRYGTDTSGRPIYMTRYAHAVWLAICADPRVKPFAHKLVVVQGMFMALVPGGGAAASDGYHDRAGCIDVRTWNLTAAELDTFIRVAREHGWAFWRRDAQHGGMDPHAHGVLGSDSPLTPKAAQQWRDYLAGFNGLASRGRDYEWRPSPLVTKPPTVQAEDDDMAVLAEKIDAVDGHSVEWVLATTCLKVQAIEKALAALAKGISPAVEKAVQDALADNVVHVDVSVKGATP